MGIKIIAKNKRASYDYFLDAKFEAGISLQGTEVKSIRAGKVKISEAFVTVDENEEVWVHNMYIAHYDFGNIHNHQETRKRKLLLNKHEIKELIKGMGQKSQTIVPTIIYFKSSRIKLEICLAKGKKLHDKRDSKAQKDVERKLRQGQYE